MKTIRGIEAFDEVKRLIVVAAHPDDLECMCGGTIWLLAQRGVEITSVNCTLGDLGDRLGTNVRPALATTRLSETEAAAQFLGIHKSYNLGHHDGELVANLELRAQIARIYRLSGADTLFTFDPYWTGQIHPDHRAAGQAALDAYMPSKMPLYRPDQLGNGIKPARIERVFLFGTDRDPDVYVDVTGVYAEKLVSCQKHVSQFPKGEEDLAWLKDRDRVGGEPIGVDYAEVFRQLAVW
jgi:LmbE family N-acetylglucosaminyl deacetylase